MPLRPAWVFVSDRVMGGVSEGRIVEHYSDGQAIFRLTGDVSLENNGGFLQMAFDLDLPEEKFDASDWSGLVFDAQGNSETYEVRLRTTDLVRPWQSFKASFATSVDWRSITMPFSSFCPHRTDLELDLASLRRIGVLATGSALRADVSVRDFCLFR